MSETTPHLSVSLIATNQAQKEVTANEAFLTFDALLNTGAISRVFTAPPASPADGDLYIIPAGATGDWTGHDASMSYYHGNRGWVVIAPNEGMTLWVNDENTQVIFNGSNWVGAYEADVTFANNMTVQGFLGGGEPQILTIASGVISATSSNIKVDTESAAATDEVDTINGGQNGDHVFVSIENSSRVVTFKDDTGNLKLAGDFVADHVTDMLHLQKRGGEWYEISRSNNA